MTQERTTVSEFRFEVTLVPAAETSAEKANTEYQPQGLVPDHAVSEGCGCAAPARARSP